VADRRWPVLDPDVVSYLLGRHANRDRLTTLSERERDVLALMAQGRSNMAISRHLVLGQGGGSLVGQPEVGGDGGVRLGRVPVIREDERAAQLPAPGPIHGTAQRDDLGDRRTGSADDDLLALFDSVDDA
jgi:hypothetical protein